MDSIQINIQQPKESGWVCYLIGKPTDNPVGTVVFKPILGSEPNRFHMLMHRIFFGFHWIEK